MVGVYFAPDEIRGGVRVNITVDETAKTKHNQTKDLVAKCLFDEGNLKVGPACFSENDSARSAVVGGFAEPAWRVIKKADTFEMARKFARPIAVLELAQRRFSAVETIYRLQSAFIASPVPVRFEMRSLRGTPRAFDVPEVRIAPHSEDSALGAGAVRVSRPPGVQVEEQVGESQKRHMAEIPATDPHIGYRAGSDLQLVVWEILSLENRRAQYARAAGQALGVRTPHFHEHDVGFEAQVERNGAEELRVRGIRSTRVHGCGCVVWDPWPGFYTGEDLIWAGPDLGAVISMRYGVSVHLKAAFTRHYPRTTDLWSKK
ncbi:hypothetical protein DFH09DRAFT_1087145 [Mycena vulgaris]|nr:hypothetical protein DFH09DRAFT_1087145 [Mycena vulgaris]